MKLVVPMNIKTWVLMSMTLFNSASHVLAYQDAATEKHKFTEHVKLRRGHRVTVGSQTDTMGVWTLSNEYDKDTRKYVVKACCNICPTFRNIEVEISRPKALFQPGSRTWFPRQAQSLSCSHDQTSRGPYGNGMLFPQYQESLPSFTADRFGSTHFGFTVRPQFY